jgi:hypothetical protein
MSGEFWPRRSGDSSVDFLALHERFPFGSFAALQYGLSSSEVYVIGRQVAKGDMANGLI